MTRRERSRLNTRRKLIESAHRVMGAKGVEQSTIEEITEGADVGFGSFYNHFSSKDELAQIIFAASAEELEHITDQIARLESDAAVAVSYMQKCFITKAVTDPVWGWFIVRTQSSLQQISDIIGGQLSGCLERGVAQQRFELGFIRTAARSSVAALLATTRGLLERQLEQQAVDETIEGLLRLYGLDKAEAARLAALPLPSYVHDLRESQYLEYLFPA